MIIMTIENNQEDLDRIHKSLDQLHNKIDNNTETLIINTVDLKHHIHRTDLLQAEVEKTEQKVEGIEKSIIEFISPFVFFKKLLIVLGIITTIALAIFKFL